ncbi:Fic family protein [Lysinibacillus xylanilyticus]|uniref:Fic/DOC family protein n=1 Tax=Lysinibacillus xylanilyticus TaxID=582475 RepID=UPI002E1A4571|nr:Fic family protein [Lysinibacillus xylanilyticus]
MNDPYLIPNSFVLKNKLNITNQEKLDIAESAISKAKLHSILDVKGNFDYKHLMDLHKHILGDIYEWAGQPRVMDIEKAEPVLSGMSVQYSNHKQIPTEAVAAINKLKNVNWSNLDTYEQKAEAFSKNMATLWQVHPFREGNTRTITEFCVQYAATQSIFLNQNLFAENASFTRNALVMASIGEYSDFSHLNRIVKDAMESGDKARVSVKEKAEQIKSTSKDIFSLKGVKEIDAKNKAQQDQTKEKKRDHSR